MTDRSLTFALAAALERAEIAECEAARDREHLRRLYAINPFIVRNVCGDAPAIRDLPRWKWSKAS